jgi:hypothetical protein
LDWSPAHARTSFVFPTVAKDGRESFGQRTEAFRRFQRLPGNAPVDLAMQPPFNEALKRV